MVLLAASEGGATSGPQLAVCREHIQWNVLPDCARSQSK